MARGKILHLTRLQVVQRALSQIAAVPLPPAGSPTDAGNYAIGYRLAPGFNGGAEPDASHCASWSYGNRRPTADCIGLVMWASGIDRMQPGYKGSADEWLCCYSVLDDAYGTNLPAGTRPQQYTRSLKAEEPALPGDWMVTRDHIGLVIRPKTRDTSTVVVDCSPRHTYEAGINTGLAWSDACKIIRPLFYTE